MHIAQTVKANVPPSSLVPGGRQHSMNLTIHNNEKKEHVRLSFPTFSVRESCENTEKSAT